LPRLKLHLSDPSDFNKFHDASTDNLSLFVPTTDAPAVGERVTVDVMFRGGPRVLLHGMVKWRRAAGDARTRPGVGVDVDESERAKMGFVLGYVRGGLLDVREKRRLPLRLRVTYSSAKGRRINFTRDLNEEGAFVRTAEHIEVGAKTQLLISPPGGDYKPIEVHAEVIRSQTDGVGVRFEYASAEERNRFLAFVHKLESDYLAGRLPEDVLL
jgi:Tfp pilus assembly protein PilZ